jgi:L-threonylcarbamoyladenylate synthase
MENPPDATGAKSPGQQAVHYAPRGPAYRFESSQLPDALRWASRVGAARPAFMVIRQGLPAGNFGCEMPGEAAEYAARFYAVLRELDARGPAAILIELPPATPDFEAVRDRIMRATKPMPCS